MNAFLRPRAVDRPALRFIGFHHAGGSAAAYCPLARRLPPDWDIVLHDLPGHGRRRSEPADRRMVDVVARAAREVAEHTDVPYVLFGHSMGAIVAVETGRLLAACQRPPLWLGVSGRVAPAAQGLPLPRLSRLDDASLFAALLRLGGIPEQLADIPELKDMFLRLVRRDLEAVDSYQPEPDRIPLPCPVTAFGGLADPSTPPETLTGWELETTAHFRQCFFPGGHFYFFAAEGADLAREIRIEVRAALSEVDRHVSSSYRRGERVTGTSPRPRTTIDA